MKKIIIGLFATLLLVTGLAACSTKAETVNHNLDKEADSFKVYREVSFINAITDKEMVRVTGYCSVQISASKNTVTCKVDGGYVRHAISRSDNTVLVYRQLSPAEVSDTHYKFLIRPGTLIPDVDFQ